MFASRFGTRMIGRTVDTIQRSSIPIQSQSRITSNFVLQKVSSFHTSNSFQTTYRRFGQSQPNFSVINRSTQHSPIQDPTKQFRRGRDNKSWARTLLIVVGIGGTYYIYHLEKVESTGRWRFMDTSVKEERLIAEESFKQILKQYQNKIISSNDPIHQLVHKVATRIVHSAMIQNQQGNIDANHLSTSFYNGIHSSSPSTTNLSENNNNQDEIKWQIFVIKDDTPNAFVLPNGKIFVMTGILPICKDEDGIATVLGHEVAHQILRHGAEKMSGSKFLLYVGFALDSLLGINIGLSSIFGQFLMELPNSRQCETEADHIGLRLMSSACFDPSKAPDLWKRMQEQEKLQGSSFSELVSTHPLSSKRMKHMQEWLPEANQIRQNSNCPAPSTISSFKDSSSVFSSSFSQRSPPF